MPDANTHATPRAALITGSGRRIGRAIALTLSRAGYAVVLHANRSRADAERLAAEIVAAGGRAAESHRLDRHDRAAPRDRPVAPRCDAG